MIKEIFHIGSFSISPFGVMLVFAFLASYLQLRWGMKRLGIGDEEDASALVFAAGVGGILGAKVSTSTARGSSGTAASSSAPSACCG
jgi:prolipoprotein diacylglyceryltransferase